MMTMYPEGESSFRNKKKISDEQVSKLVEEFQPAFVSLARNYLLFHLFFFLFCFIEVFSFILFFSFFLKHALIAFTLALIFLTCFSYFLLYSYYQTQKPEKYKSLKNSFKEILKEVLEYQEEIPDSHIAMANACYLFSKSLEGAEFVFYPLPSFLAKFFSLSESFSVWAHRHDVYFMKELLLLEAIEEQIKLVKCAPISMEAHTALANGYVLLSSLYTESSSQNDENEKSWNFFKLPFDRAKQKFQKAAECAIEEFKILCKYAPNDPWVHEQLAYSYCELQRPLEAISEFEILLKLNSSDPGVLYKLGKLYFQLGRNADGLRVYELLKNAHYMQAEMLIAHYGTMNS